MKGLIGCPDCRGTGTAKHGVCLRQTIGLPKWLRDGYERKFGDKFSPLKKNNHHRRTAMR